MTIYERIQEIAKRKRLTVRDIERHLGYANGSLRKWKSNANSERLLEVADFLGVTTDYLLGKTSLDHKIDEPWKDEVMWELDRDSDYELRKGVLLSAFNSLVDFSILVATAKQYASERETSIARRKTQEISNVEREEIAGSITEMFYYWLLEPKEHKREFVKLLNNTFDDYAKKRTRQFFDEHYKNNKE